MKVETEFEEGEDGDDRYSISINGEQFVNAGGGEPEDNSLDRDLNFVFEIPKMLLKAYAAGKAGEEFSLIETTRKQDE